MEMEAHDISVVLPRGLRIEDEEQDTPKKTSGTTFFSKYERRRSLKQFMDPEVKYTQNHQSHMRMLKKTWQYANFSPL